MARPRTRANREGRVYQRGSDKRWVGVVWPPEKQGGKPRYVYGKTRDEAKQKKERLEAELADAMPGTAGKDTTLARYFGEWLGRKLPQEVAAGHMAQSTLDSYRDNADKHILPDLGKITLRHLTAPRIREWQYDLGRKPSGRPRRTLRQGEKELPPAPVLSPRTVAYCRAILHKALADAIDDEVYELRHNVVDKVKPPKQQEREIAPPDKAECRALLAASSKDRLSCYWLVVLGLGLRRGEGLGLRWGDIDFEARTVTLRQTVQRMRGDADAATGRRKGKLVTKDLKTKASKATVPVPDSLLGALAAWRRKQAGMQLRARVWLEGTDLVFTTRLGTALEPRGVNRAWEALCDKAGVRRMRIHDLRHAWGTFMDASGVGQKAIQKGLRHARRSTTDIYIHALEETMRDTADAMEAVLAELRPGSRETAQ